MALALSTRANRATLALGLFALLSAGCIFGKDDSADEPKAADPVPGSGAPAADPGASPPPLDFGQLGTTPAGPDDETTIADSDPGPSVGQIMWGVDDRNHLLRFGTGSLDQVAVKAITGLVDGDRVLDIDFRPASGVLFALGSLNRIYTLDTTTAAATVVGDAPFMTPAVGQGHGIDFNPVADKLRVHTDVDVNLRIDPLTGAATMDAPIAFADGDPNVGQSPNLVGNAYTNNATTVLYAIDSTRDLLVMLPAPNDGTVKTVGALGVDTEGFVGFDIRGADAAKQVFATMRVGGRTGLYSLDLVTGAAKLMGEIGYPRSIPGLALAP